MQYWDDFPTIGTNNMCCELSEKICVEIAVK